MLNRDREKRKRPPSDRLSSTLRSAAWRRSRKSARDFPTDYNPPARMGRAYLALGRPDDAIASVERALALAYGPRKLTLWSLEADAYLAKGDRAGARRAVESAIAFAEAHPRQGGYGKVRGTLEQRLAALPR